MEQKHIDRFWGFVDKSGDCWIWKGCKDRGGYGFFRYKGKSLRAHRVSFELCVGEISEGNYICHRCDNPKCVNPSHLFQGTCMDNWNDCVNKGRSKWKENHPFRENPNLMSRGESVNTSKLTEDSAKSLFIEYITTPKSYGKLKRICEKYGITKSQVFNVLSGKSWSHLKLPLNYSHLSVLESRP